MCECIICRTEQNTFSDEHVFPESIGGRYVLKNMVCKTCNNKELSTLDNKITDCYPVVQKRLFLDLHGKKGGRPKHLLEGKCSWNDREIITKINDEKKLDLTLIPKTSIKKIDNNKYRQFNNEVQHLGKQKGKCYPKWLWKNTSN